MQKEYDFKSMVKNFRKNLNEFRTNFAKKKRFDENFRFRSYFRWLNEIFSNEIKRKFGNPNKEFANLFAICKIKLFIIFIYLQFI